MAETLPPPPSGPPVAGPVIRGSEAGITATGFGAGIFGAVTGVCAALAVLFVALLAGTPPGPGSVAVIGSADPTLAALAIPAGIVAFFGSIAKTVRLRFESTADQCAAAMIAIPVGLVAPFAYLIAQQLTR